MKLGNCRKAFTSTLLAQARQDKSVMALVSDSRGSVTLTDFSEVLPNQLIEVGIAEQNEVGIAAGLAMVGLKPYVCAPASFLSARALEQIKVDVASSGLNVKIVGVSGGISYGALGYSHHSTHDIAVMRALTGLEVYLPCDANQTKKLFEALAKSDRPAYIRLGRADVPEVYEDDDVPLVLGKANQLREGGDLTIIATGEMVYPALMAADVLAPMGLSARVLDMHTIKPLDREGIISAAADTGRIVTLEEHSICGGLGGAVSEVVVENHPVPMLLLGLPDEELITGESSEVKAHYRLDGKGVAEQIKQWME